MFCAHPARRSFPGNRFFVGCLTVLALSTGCSTDSETSPHLDGDDALSGLFTDVTHEWGIARVSTPWPAGSYQLVEITGGGVALLDYDNDDDLDLLQICCPPPDDASNSARNRLYQQQPDGSFRDVTETAGLVGRGYGQGVAVGDADDDGDLDLYITNHGPDVFYLNQGDGTFVNRTASAGFQGDDWSVSAAFFDFDRDGDLDLFVVHYGLFDPSVRCKLKSTAEDYCGPQMFAPRIDTLYRNDGSGKFTDVTAEVGINSAGRGLGLACFDFTRDGLIDIFVSNDGENNHLWVNQANGTFVDEAIIRGVAVNAAGEAEASMGIGVGDANGDGLVDLYVTHLRSETNTFYAATATGLFDDRTTATGLARIDLPYTGFGCDFIDFDNDGDLDIAVANGRVKHGAVIEGGPQNRFWQSYAEPNLLIENEGNGHFSDASRRAGDFGQRVDVSRGLAVGDIDRDGDLDVVVGEIGGPPRIYRNNLKSAAHWLSVRVLTENRDAYGAEVQIVVAGRRVIRPILAGRSYASSGEARAHFGLGTNTRVDSLEVIWPDGRREKFAVEKIDARLTIRQGEGLYL